MKEIDWDKKRKNWKCQICGEIGGKDIHLYVGGKYHIAHESCIIKKEESEKKCP